MALPWISMAARWSSRWLGAAALARRRPASIESREIPSTNLLIQSLQLRCGRGGPWQSFVSGGAAQEPSGREAGRHGGSEDERMPRHYCFSWKSSEVVLQLHCEPPADSPNAATSVTSMPVLVSVQFLGGLPAVASVQFHDEIL